MHLSIDDPSFFAKVISSHFTTFHPQIIFMNRHHRTRHKRLANEKRSFVACLVRKGGWNIPDSSSKLKIIIGFILWNYRVSARCATANIIYSSNTNTTVKMG
jgi:hypothetical protein